MIIEREDLKVEKIDYNHIFDINTEDKKIKVIEKIELQKNMRNHRKPKPKTAFRRDDNPLVGVNDYKDTQSNIIKAGAEQRLTTDASEDKITLNLRRLESNSQLSRSVTANQMFK